MVEVIGGSAVVAVGILELTEVVQGIDLLERYLSSNMSIQVGL